MDYRPLTRAEVDQLISFGCRAEDWSTVETSDPESLKGGAKIHTNVYKIPGYGDLCGEFLAPSVKDVASKSESMKTINIPCQRWYTTIAPEIGKMIVGLMGGDIDGDTFRQRGYDLFKGIADDSNIEKFEFKG